MIDIHKALEVNGVAINDFASLDEMGYKFIDSGIDPNITTGGIRDAELEGFLESKPSESFESLDAREIYNPVVIGGAVIKNYDSMIPPCESTRGICDIDDLNWEITASHLRKLSESVNVVGAIKLEELPSLLGINNILEVQATSGFFHCVLEVAIGNISIANYSSFLKSTKEWCEKGKILFEHDEKSDKSILKFDWYNK